MQKQISVREALRDGIVTALRNNNEVILMGEEVAQYQGAYKITEGLLNEFGAERIIDTPISEHAIAGIGIGASMLGMRIIVEFMTFNFAMQAIDQIINSAAKTHYMSGGLITCPIVFRGPNGSASKVGAQHSQCYAAWYSHIPGLKVIAPYFALDFKLLIQAAVSDNNPVVFLENEILYNEIHDIEDEFDIEPERYMIGKARVVRKGTNVTIVTFSICVGKSLKAAELLQDKYKISAEVIDLRTLRPLDIETVITSIKKTHNIVTVEEGWGTCGIGAEINMKVIEMAFDELDSQPTRVCGKDIPLPYAVNLENAAIPNVEDIVEAVLSLYSKSSATT